MAGRRGRGSCVRFGFGLALREPWVLMHFDGHCGLFFLGAATCTRFFFDDRMLDGSIRQDKFANRMRGRDLQRVRLRRCRDREGRGRPPRRIDKCARAGRMSNLRRGLGRCYGRDVRASFVVTRKWLMEIGMRQRASCRGETSDHGHRNEGIGADTESSDKVLRHRQ